MLAEPGRGMYESYYFRGTSEDGNHAFWLKHNMLRYRGSDDVWLEGALVLFDRAACRTSAVYAHEAMDAERFARMTQQATNWEHVALELHNGSSVQIARGYVGGHLVGEGGNARWDLQVHRSDLSLQHFPHEAMYKVPWPGNKVVTRDCHVDFHGSVWAGDLAFSGRFHGMNGHNWGSGHAQAYQYANCARFDGVDDAYFDGFSARVAFAAGRMISPWMSMASLHLRGEWLHFNSMGRALNHEVSVAGEYAWRARFGNGTHSLDVDIDGATPQELPWAALHYDHPDRNQSVVRNTKFAALKLRVSRRGGDVEDELVSNVCELETLRAATLQPCSGYIGTP
jgi:hypothetical protein